MNPDGESNESTPEDGSESSPDAAESRLKRLKQLVLSRYLRVIDAMSGVLKRLRSRVGKSRQEEDQEDEKGEPRASRKTTKAPHADEAAVAAAPPAPRSPVRSFFIYLLVLLVGILTGMIFSFALLSNMVINQAQKIGDQRDEIAQLEKQYSRVLQSEAKYRNRVSEVEAQLDQITRTTVKETAAVEASTAPAATSEKPAKPRNVGNCALESGDPGKLARCIDEFNRKGSR